MTPTSYRKAAYDSRNRRIHKAAHDIRREGFSGTDDELAIEIVKRLRCYYKALPVSEVREELSHTPHEGGA